MVVAAKRIPNTNRVRRNPHGFPYEEPFGDYALLNPQRRNFGVTADQPAELTAMVNGYRAARWADEPTGPFVFAITDWLDDHPFAVPPPLRRGRWWRPTHVPPLGRSYSLAKATWAGWFGVFAVVDGAAGLIANMLARHPEYPWLALPCDFEPDTSFIFQLDRPRRRRSRHWYKTGNGGDA